VDKKLIEPKWSATNEVIAFWNLVEDHLSEEASRTGDFSVSACNLLREPSLPFS
jgi:hypothetical protein